MHTSAPYLDDRALAETCRRAEHAYLRASDETAIPLDALLEARPDFLPLHLLRIGRLVVAKDAHSLPALRRALARCAVLERDAGEHGRALLAGARAWLAARPLQAAEIYTRAALETPRDLLALRLAQSCWYFLGERGRMRSVTEQVAESWPADLPGCDIVLALQAFGCAETADGVRAEELARQALAIEPRSPCSIHALVHALVMQNRPAEGARVLRARPGDWRVGGRMDSHNAWHLATLELECGDAAAALAAYDRDLAGPALHDAGGCADATDLLWRLELAGVDVAARWQSLSDAWARHLQPGFWGFLDVLAGLSYLRAGHRPRAHALALAIAGSAGDPAQQRSAARAATLSALAALDAFVDRAYARAGAALRSSFPHLGGSLPQRGLLGLTLSVAQRRSAPGPSLVPAAA